MELTCNQELIKKQMKNKIEKGLSKVEFTKETFVILTNETAHTHLSKCRHDVEGPKRKEETKAPVLAGEIFSENVLWSLIATQRTQMMP